MTRPSATSYWKRCFRQKTSGLSIRGAATFLHLMRYLIKNEIIAFLEENGRREIINTPLIGGPAMEETIRGLKSILEFGISPIVVWENEFFGPVAMNGKRFVQTAGYDAFKSRILGVIRLAKGDPQHEEKDMGVMNSRWLT